MSFLQSGSKGKIAQGGEVAWVVLLHDSPDDQEAVQVELLDDFICLEAGEIIEIQRYEFIPESNNG